MATRDDLRLEVRDLLGEADASNWTNAELDRRLIRSIRKIRNAVPVDALLKLRNERVAVATRVTDNAGVSTAYLDKPTGLYHLIKIISEESDGEYGNPWQYVTEKDFWRVRRYEGDAEYDSTTTRIYTDGLYGIAPTTQSGYFWKLYPYPSTYYIKVVYIAQPATTGTMTLPTDDPDLQYLVIMDTVAMAAAKKSRDLELASWARNEYNAVLSIIRHDFTNKYGLTPADIGVAGDYTSD